MKYKGFSLIEIIVAVTIMALLAVVATTGVRKQRERSADVSTIDQAVTIGSALDQYQAVNQSLPVNNGTTPASVSLQYLVTAGYLTNVPTKLPNATATGTTFCDNYLVLVPFTSAEQQNGSAIGTRIWGIQFSTFQTAPDANQTNPLSERVFSKPTKDACSGKKAASFIYGAKP